jgi:hypothetical protein
LIGYEWTITLLEEARGPREGFYNRNLYKMGLILDESRNRFSRLNQKRIHEAWNFALIPNQDCGADSFDLEVKKRKCPLIKKFI